MKQILIGQRVLEVESENWKQASVNTIHLPKKKRIDKCLMRAAYKLLMPCKIQI